MPHTNNTKLSKLLTGIIPLTIIALVSVIALAAVAKAYTYTISLNLTDARLPNAKILNETLHGVVYNETVGKLYNETVRRLAPWYFTANKEYRLIILNATDTYYKTAEGTFKLGEPVLINVTAKANKSGGVTFEVTVPDTERFYLAYWMIILTVRAWNHEWLVLNFTTAAPMLLDDVLTNITGNKSILAINSTIFEEILSNVSNYGIKPNYFIANVSRIGTANPYNASNAVLNVTYRNGVMYVYKGSSLVARYVPERIGAVNLTKTSGKKIYAWRLPYVQAFFLGLGRFSKSGVAEKNIECTKYIVKVYLVTPKGEVEIFSGGYNKTFTSIANYCAFGPIYYVTSLYRGVTSVSKTHNTITYKVVKVETQSPYNSVYLNLTVIRILPIGGKTLTVATITTKPKGLRNYGAVALMTNSTWAVNKKVNVTAVGLYGWTLNGTRRVLDIFPVLALPLIKATVNTSSLKTLLDRALPYYMTEKLEYKWFVGDKLINVGKSTVFAGKLKAEIYISDNYAPKIVHGKPNFKLLGVYSLRIWYRQDAVAFINVTDLLSKALNNTISDVEVNGTLPLALVPVVVYLHKLEPNTNASQAPSLPAELVQSSTPIKVVIERAEVPRGPYYEYMNATPMENESNVVLTPGPFTIYGVRIRPSVIFLPAPEPIKVNLTGKVGSEKVYTAKVSIERPTTALAVYYYKFNIYYGNVKAGVAVFAVGAKVYSTAPPTLEKYCLELGDKSLCAVVYPVAGNKILHKFTKYVAQYYWNETQPLNVSLLEPVPSRTGTQIVWNLTKVTAHVCHIGVAVTPLIAYFETLYGKLISDELPSGVNAFVRVVEVTEGKERTVAALSARSVYETFIAIPVELNKTGWPVTRSSSTSLKFVLDYEGYELVAVNRTTGKPLLLKLSKVLTVKEAHVTFPLVRTTLKVVSANGEPLIGFVVEVRSIYTNNELWMAITNDKGEVYVGLLPAGEPVKIIVRTLKPKKDKSWFETSTATNKALESTKNNYAEYAKWMTGKEDAIVYTLGTRGAADAGVVVNVTTIKVPGVSSAKDGTVTLPEIRVVNVRPLKVYVVYKGEDGKYHILKTVAPVYPCGIPGYCSAIIYNTTLIIDDSVYRNASRMVKSEGNYTADFRVIAISWMKPIFERLEKAFEKAAEHAKSEAEAHEKSFSIWLKWIKDYVANETFALTARYLAMCSTNSPEAVFTLPLMLGKNMEEMHIARVWLPGQTLHMKVYYMGYEVFNSYVPVPPYNETVVVTPSGNVTYKKTVSVDGKTVPPGSIVLVASVKPVTFKIVEANVEKPVGKLYLGLLFTDALFRTYVVTAGMNVKPLELAWPITEPFNTTKPVVVLREARLKTSLNVTVNGEWKNASRLIGKVFGLIVKLPIDLDMVAMNATLTPSRALRRYLLPLATNVSDVFNVTLAMSENYTELNMPTGTKVILKVKPLVSLLSLYNVLVYEVNVTPAKTVKLTESSHVENITWSGLSIYKYNISSIMLELNTTDVSKLSKLYVRLYVKHNDKTDLLLTVNETSLVRRLLGRIFNVTIPVPRDVIESRIPKNVSYVTPILEINATGLKGTLYVKALITTGAGLTARVVNVTLGRFSNGTALRTEIMKIKPLGVWTKYFGSPMLVIVPVGPTGSATVLLPEWTESVAGAGARIARIYLIGVKSTPGVAIKSSPEVYPISEGVVPEVRFHKYVLLNIIELPAKVTAVNYTLTRRSVEMNKVVYLLGENATSTLMYRFAIKPVELADVYKTPETVVLPVAIVSKIKVENSPSTEGYPVLVYEVTVNGLKTAAVPTVVKPKTTAMVPVGYLAINSTNVTVATTKSGKLYLYAMCDLNLTAIKDLIVPYRPKIAVSLKYWPPNMTFYEVVPGAKKPVREVKVTSEELVQFENKLTDIKKFTIDLTEHGGIIPKFEYKYDVLPLKTVFTWSGDTVVPYATVAVFKSENSSLCKPIAISFTDADGNLMQPLPTGKKVMVFWYNSYIEYLNTTCRGASGTSASFAAPGDKTYLPVVIYDSSIREDVEKLGNATISSSVRTWTYMMKVVVTNRMGKPVPNAIVIVYDSLTHGRYFYGVGVTGTDGSVIVRDVLIPVKAVVPPMPYVVEVYIPIKTKNGQIIALYGGLMRQTLQRGSAQPIQILPVSSGATILSVPIKLVTIVATAGAKVIPLAGATASVSEVVPASVLNVTKIYGAKVYLPVGTVKVPISFGVKTANEEGTITVSPVYVSAAGITNVSVKVLSYGNIELGYTKTVRFTIENVTSGPVYVRIPGAELKVYALSANRVPLGSAATTSITCMYNGKIIATTTVRGDTASVMFPLPYDVVVGKRTIRCVVSAQAAGVNKTETVTIGRENAGKVVKATLVVPISGVVLPGGTFVPMQTLITALVVALIVIIIIVIGLMEYNTWRRKRLVSIIGAPGPAR